MNGTKPTNMQTDMHTVVRNFRGQRLVWSEYSHDQYRWTSDCNKAAKFAPAVALRIAEKASRDYGAQCSIEDSTGRLVDPATARKSYAPATGKQAKLRTTNYVFDIATVDDTFVTFKTGHSVTLRDYAIRYLTVVPE